MFTPTGHKVLPPFVGSDHNFFHCHSMIECTVLHKNSSPPRLVCSKQSAKAPIKGGSQFPNHTTLQLITTTKCIRTNLSESGIINKPQRPTFIERTLSNLLKLSIIKYLPN